MRTLWRFIAGFFKWTWRLLNFVREMVLNLFFIFLVLVGVGHWLTSGHMSTSRWLSLALLTRRAKNTLLLSRLFWTS